MRRTGCRGNHALARRPKFRLRFDEPISSLSDTARHWHSRRGFEGRTFGFPLGFSTLLVVVRRSGTLSEKTRYQVMVAKTLAGSS